MDASSSAAWSPDGAWLIYAAEHDQPGTLDLYAVDMREPEPAVAMLVTQPRVLESSEFWSFRVSPNAEWLYVVANIDGAPRLYRTFLGGDAPGELQALRGGIADGTMRSSHDGTRLLYRARPDALARDELLVVDVGGVTPGEPRTVNAPLGPDEGVDYTFDWSRDDSAIVYALYRGFDMPSPSYAVDSDTLEGRTLLVDNTRPLSTIVLHHLPPR